MQELSVSLHTIPTTRSSQAPLSDHSGGKGNLRATSRPPALSAGNPDPDEETRHPGLQRVELLLPPSLAERVELRFIVEGGDVTIQLLGENGRIIRQIPPEEIQRLRRQQDERGLLIDVRT